MQGAATVDDRPTTSGDDDDRIVMVKLLIALASLEPNDKRLNFFDDHYGDGDTTKDKIEKVSIQ